MRHGSSVACAYMHPSIYVSLKSNRLAKCEISGGTIIFCGKFWLGKMGLVNTKGMCAIALHASRKIYQNGNIVKSFMHVKESIFYARNLTWLDNYRSCKFGRENRKTICTMCYSPHPHPKRAGKLSKQKWAGKLPKWKHVEKLSCLTCMLKH